jgi:hypothetical protein
LPGGRSELRGELPIVHRGVVLPQHVTARAKGSGGEHDADANSNYFPPGASQPPWPPGTPGSPGTPRQPNSCAGRLCAALLDMLGHGFVVRVVRVPGFGCLAQLQESCPSLLGARFSPGNFVLVGIGQVRRVITMLSVSPLRIVHGEGAYHFGPGPTPSSGSRFMALTCGNARSPRGRVERRRSGPAPTAVWLR